jgi:hypothetical protein
LPVVKREVRKGRLDSYLKQMQNFRTQHFTGVEVQRDKMALPLPNAEDAFSNIYVSTKARSLPALPFLVPSVIEALANSRFAGETKVVPAEADTYCASFAKENGGTIITSDSDLLAYDLQPDGCVLLFKDIELEGNNPTTKLKMLRYETSAIARRLGLKSLQSLSFTIRQDQYLGFTQCLKQARQLEEKKASEEYHAFLSQYSLPGIHEWRYNQNVQDVLQRLDPRISEWIHQVLQDTDVEADQSFDMYLPFLMEDTTRVSAWNMGADLRMLTYSIFMPLATERHVTVQFARRGICIAATRVEHQGLSDTVQSLSAWSDILEKVLAACKGTVGWRLLGLFTVCHVFREEETGKLPPRGDLRKLLAGQTIGQEWTFLHWSAQFAAAAARVHRSLQNLPEIHDMFDSTRIIEDDELDAYIDTLYRLLGVREAAPCQQAEAAICTTKTKKKRKRDKAKHRPNARPLAPLSSSNMFQLLPSSP